MTDSCPIPDSPAPLPLDATGRPLASPARLRGHHLICLRYFVGQGYSEEFVRNLAEVLELAQERLVVVDGADDVCAVCPTLGSDFQCEHEPGAEAGIRQLDSLAFELLGVAPGDEIAFADLAGRVASILPRWVAEACEGCEWATVCDRVRRSREDGR